MGQTPEASVTCEACGKMYRWQAALAGRNVKCKCGQIMAIPAQPPSAAPPARSASAQPAPRPAPKPLSEPLPTASKPALEINLDDDDLKIDLNTPASDIDISDPNEDSSDGAYDLAIDEEPSAAPAPRPTPPPATAPEPDAIDALSALAASPIATAAPAANQCPSCNSTVNPGAIICISCGFNLKEGVQLKTESGGVVRAAASGSGQARRNAGGGDPVGFFARIARSWEFAKISYGIIWDFKRLLVFPIFSSIACILVLASFLVPLSMASDTVDQWFSTEPGGGHGRHPMIFIIAFAFYFCNYFVIVFFNTALTACAMKVTSGDVPTISYGLQTAVKRLPQIVTWALLSAVVGVLLKAIESFHEKLGRLISLLLGSAWTVMTYLVVPVLVVEGVGPFQAVKRSISTLKETWGEGLVGNAAMGMLAFLISLPLVGLIFLGCILASQLGSTALLVAVLAVGVIAMLTHAAASSAADVVFKALLYNYATGRSMPADLDEDVFASAFGSKGLIS